MPVAVSKQVSRINVRSRYRREILLLVFFGASSHLPFCSVPINAAKQAGEEKSGQHNQSIDPFFPTSAAVSQSPIRA
jgi:hypothetical protein